MWRFGKKSKEKVVHIDKTKLFNSAWETVYSMYLNARDLEDQTLAKEIAEKYDIDYDMPVLTPKMMRKINDELTNLEKIRREQETKRLITEVLKENGIINEIPKLNTEPADSDVIYETFKQKWS